MKRILCTVLAVAVMFCLIPVTALASEEPAFVVSTEEAGAGSTVEIAVRTENNPGIASFELIVSYDSSALEWVDVKKGDWSGIWDAAVGETVLWVDADDHTDNTVIFILVFRVKEDASEGLHEVSVSYETGNVFDENENDIVFDTRSGGVTVKGIHTHDWDEGRVTISPTATADGVRTYTCRTCGETRTEVVPATGEVSGPNTDGQSAGNQNDPKPDTKPGQQNSNDPQMEDEPKGSDGILRWVIPAAGLIVIVFLAVMVIRKKKAGK